MNNSKDPPAALNAVVVAVAAIGYFGATILGGLAWWVYDLTKEEV